MKIIPVIENSRVEEFHNERGLSLYIETKNKKILFDTGVSDKVIKNLIKLGIDISEIDYFIISHGHKDHIGGLRYLLDAGIDPGRVVIKKGVVSTYYFKCFIKKEIGLSSEDVKRLEGIEEVEVGGLYRLEEDIYLISPKGRSSPFYYKGRERDDFSHELSLVVVEDGRLNVVVGCCHFGVERLLESLNCYFPGYPINSLTGGLHTRNLPLNPGGLIRYIKLMKKSGIKKYYLGHCTGEMTISIMKRYIEGVDKISIGRSYHT